VALMQHTKSAAAAISIINLIAYPPLRICRSSRTCIAP
jgi:hypothetical protein